LPEKAFEVIYSDRQKTMQEFGDEVIEVGNLKARSPPHLYGSYQFYDVDLAK
jgi:hypothetical protein